MPNAQCPQADFDLWPESAALQPTAATIAVLHLTGSKALIAASNQTAATCDTTPSHQAKMKALLMSGGKRGSLRTPDKRRLSLSGAANTARANDPAVGGQRGRVFLRRPRVVEEGGGSSGGSGGGGGGGGGSGSHAAGAEASNEASADAVPGASGRSDRRTSSIEGSSFGHSSNENVGRTCSIDRPSSGHLGEDLEDPPDTEEAPAWPRRLSVGQAASSSV